jgi:hypothetical protein
MFERRHAMKTILARATTDRAFREALLAEPRQAIEQSCGLVIPADFKIRFIEKTEGLDALVVLPDFQDGAGELSDEELEAASGGGGGDGDTW